MDYPEFFQTIHLYKKGRDAVADTALAEGRVLAEELAKSYGVGMSFDASLQLLTAASAARRFPAAEIAAMSDEAIVAEAQNLACAAL